MKQPPIIKVQFFHIKGPMPLTGKESSFYGPVITIGRNPSCHLRFPSDLTYISRQHAEIVREGNQFKLIDHSTNGTYLNGKRIKEGFLKDGDVLMIGEGGPQISFLTQMEEGVVESEPSTPLARIEPKKGIQKEPIPVEPSLPPKYQPEEPPFKQEAMEVAAQPTKAPLIIQYGPTIRSFKQLPIVIGKSSQCEYPLNHPGLLDHHAQIFFNEGQYWVKDLTGQKLVRINRQSIGFQSSLRANDELSLTPQGPHFRFFGEGRLGEIEEAQEEKPIQPPEKVSVPKEEKSISSKLKKIFKS